MQLAKQIVIKTATSEERFEGSTDARLVPYVARFVTEDAAKRREFLAIRIKLGSVLWQFREQVSHGDWTKVLRQLEQVTSVHRASMRNALKLASRFSSDSGEVSEERWKQRQKDLLTMLGAEDPNCVRARNLTPQQLGALTVPVAQASIRQATLLAHDSWENEPMGVPMTPEMEAEIFETDRKAFAKKADEDELEGDEAEEGEGYDEEPDLCEAPESGEDVPTLEAGQPPLVIGKQYTLHDFFAAVSEGVTDTVRRATTDVPAAVVSRVDEATKRYLAEVSAICSAG